MDIDYILCAPRDSSNLGIKPKGLNNFFMRFPRTHCVLKNENFCVKETEKKIEHDPLGQASPPFGERRH